MRMVLRSTLIAALAAFGASACSGGGDPPKPTGPSTTTNTMSCDSPIAEADQPVASSTTQLDAAALQADATSPTRQSAKIGIQVRSATPVTIASADPDVTIQWGNVGGSTFSSVLVVPSCTGANHKAWLAFPGGIAVSKPQCVELKITVGGQSQCDRPHRHWRAVLSPRPIR